MGGKKTILLIDDEADLVEALAFQLKARKGYEVVTARNGLEGLERLKEIDPHLIILDMNMPKMGGIEFYKTISDSDGKPRYPVLILTARANLEQLFKEFNVDGFMTKPFELECLMNEAAIIIKKRHERPEAKKAGTPRGPKKVLIVEDDKAAFDKIVIAFLNAGYVVNSAQGGMAAIDKIMADLPDLIVIKLGLSDMPGDLVVSKLKQMPRTMDIGVVLYTPQSGELNYIVTEKICRAFGIGDLVESDDPHILLKKAELALKGRSE